MLTGRILASRAGCFCAGICRSRTRGHTDPQSPSDIVVEPHTRRLHRVWLVGGGELAASFRAHGLIDEYVIGVIPTILGAGIPLFASPGPGEQLKLVECKAFPKGEVLLRYLRASDG